MEQHILEYGLSLFVFLKSVTVNAKSPEDKDEVLGLEVFFTPSLPSSSPVLSFSSLSLLIYPHCYSASGPYRWRYIKIRSHSEVVSTF